MILSCGRVVGNVNPVGEQWKEARDNRVKKNGNLAATGKEIIPLGHNHGQQVQGSGNVSQNKNTPVQVIASTIGNQQNNGKQMVPVDAGQQIQTANKFVALQVEEVSNEENQLAVVEAVDVQNTPIQKKLNPAAAGFTPKSTGVESSKRVNSCQDIPSQSLDTSVIPEQENLADRVNFAGGKLWNDQYEEESDEGEFLEGHEDVEEVQEKDPDVEEQSVNGKNSRVEIQSVDGGNNVNTTDNQLLQIEQHSNSPHPSNPENPSPAAMIEPIANTKDTGDTGDPGDHSSELQQQQLEKIRRC
ncbi:hypothetical protein A4A49_31276 [Nicotiana attenuata]|uniref:Uncharacterized protein n=1 Tax=Nicotiana attenuata TaxID=49451 RepID=A0A314KHL3_NICAT|nr:hypothetical protein A4A49_31276 [Nicotiana attenuata]